MAADSRVERIMPGWGIVGHFGVGVSGFGKCVRGMAIYDMYDAPRPPVYGTAQRMTATSFLKSASLTGMGIFSAMGAFWAGCMLHCEMSCFKRGLRESLSATRHPNHHQTNQPSQSAYRGMEMVWGPAP